ncbi:MAG: PEGA domain-containing protein [Myxococcales bacterium]|nr:MAG: PEGA domain-containing protein [Myxococcales bacterium]
MTHTFRRLHLGLWLCGALTASASAWAAEPATPAGPTPPSGTASPADKPSPAAVEEAGRRYDRGLKFYSEGDYRLAVIEFERTYELVPDYRVLYNIGQVRIQLGDYARARKALERYLKEGEGQLKPEREKAVHSDLEMLESRTATLRINCSEAGADVLVDGEAVGTTPLPEAVLMNAGEHNIELRKLGFRSQTLRRTLAGSDASELEVKLEAIPAAAPAAALSPISAPPVANRSTTPMWIGWSLTGGLAAGAIVTGVLGNRAADDLEDARGQKDVTASSLKSDANKAKMLLITSDALAAAAVVTGGISLYLTLKAPSRDTSKDSARIGLSVAPGGLRLVGTY